MKSIVSIIFALVVISSNTYGQKGIDSQTQKIKEENNKTTTRGAEASRTIDWGRGKTKTRERLANPYKLNSRRDALVSTIIGALKEMKMVVDEASSRIGDGLIVTQPHVFAKGPVIAQTELHRYGDLPSADSAWSRGRFTLAIEVQSIDGIQNHVSVIAKIEGRAGNGLISEWTTVPSSGEAEDEFLAKLVEIATGISPDPVQDEIP
ncbi:MAG: hypothetical protein WBD22_06470 [Pyrinomonadaceae bacterium]